MKKTVIALTLIALLFGCSGEVESPADAVEAPATESL